MSKHMNTTAIRPVPEKVWIGTFAGANTLPSQDHVVVVKSTDEDAIQRLEALYTLSYQVVEFTANRVLIEQTPRSSTPDLAEFRAKLRGIE